MGDYFEPGGYIGRGKMKPANDKVEVKVTLPDGTGATGQISIHLLTGDIADDSSTIAKAAREVAYTALKNRQIRKLGGTPTEE